MFFYIGEHQDNYLTKVHDRLYLDDGWNYVDNIWFKGYVLGSDLRNEIASIVKGATPKGIWCLIKFNGTDYDIYYPNPRGFPLYKQNNEITNLKLLNFIQENDHFSYYDDTLSYNDVVKRVKNALVENCKNHYNNKKVYIHCTGGIDSLSIVSIFEYANIPYSIYFTSPRDLTTRTKDVRFWEGSVTEYESALIKKLRVDFWGYEILSNFKEPKILITGFYGDEYVCRGPYQLNLLANVFTKNILDVVTENDYMYSYLQKLNKKNNNFTIQPITEFQAKSKIKKELAMDHQIWHLDNTLTFCPYFDERIINDVLSMPADEIIKNSIDATLQKNIIEICYPNLLILLDDQKNSKSGRFNFINNKDKVNLNFCEEIIIL